MDAKLCAVILQKHNIILDKGRRYFMQQLEREGRGERECERKRRRQMKEIETKKKGHTNQRCEMEEV